MGFCAALPAQNPNCFDLNINNSVDFKNIFIVNKHSDTFRCDSNYNLCMQHLKMGSALIYTPKHKPIIVKDSSYKVSIRFEKNNTLPNNSERIPGSNKSQNIGNHNNPYTGPLSFYTSLFFGHKLVVPIDHSFSNNIVLNTLSVYIAFAQYDYQINLKLQIYKYDLRSTNNENDLFNIVKSEDIFYEDSIKIGSGRKWYIFNFDSLVLPSQYLIVFYLPKNNIYDDIISNKVNLIGIGTYRFKFRKYPFKIYKTNYSRAINGKDYNDIFTSLELFKDEYLPIFLKYEVVY